MRFILLFIILQLCSFSGLCQNNTDKKTKQETIDSLITVIENAVHDSTRIKGWKAWDNIIYNDDEELDFQLNQKIAVTCTKNLENELEITEKKFFQKHLVTSLNVLGLIYFARANFELADSMYSESLRLAISIDDKPGMTNAYNNLGNLYFEQGDYELALKSVTKGLDIRLEIKDSMGIAGSYNNLALLYDKKGEYSKALEYHFKSLEIKEALKSKRHIASSLNNIGLLYYRQGNYQKALEYLERCIKIWEEYKYKYGIASTLDNLAVVYEKIGDLVIARDKYKKSLEIYSSMNYKLGMSVVQNNLGRLSLLDKKHAEAISYFEESIQLKKELNDREGMAISYNNLSKVYGDQGEFEKAISLSKLSLSIGEEIFSPTIKRQALNSLVNWFRNTDSLDEASHTLKLLIELNVKSLSSNFPFMSEMEKELYFNSFKPSYDIFADFALEYNSIDPSIVEDVYDNALFSKSLLLKSSTALRATILESGDPAMIATYNKWIKIKKQITKIYADGGDATKLEDRANELERELAKGSQSFSDILSSQRVKWKDVQAKLNDHEAAIEFIKFPHYDYNLDTLQTEMRYCALIITKKCLHPVMINLFNEESLANIIGTFPGNNISYIEDMYGNDNDVKNNLYNIIWKPLEKDLIGCDRVYISPIGLLHKISFAAISKDQETYLCDEYQLEHQSSTASVVFGAESSIKSHNKAGVFGGVIYDSDSTLKTRTVWEYLEGSREETDDIVKMLVKNKKEVSYFCGLEAKEDAFKTIAGECNILHIATHGFFFDDPDLISSSFENTSESNEDLIFRGAKNGYGYNNFVSNQNPLMRSGIVLAGANRNWIENTSDEEDGILTAQEIANLDLRELKLVVLSACETGLGDIKGSEGVYGLQRSFKLAGSDFIIMSLWQVPDKETAEFMTIFYKELLKNEDIKTAFHFAQKKARDTYDPYYWGAFVLLE